MKTMTKKEFYEELERERKSAVRIVAIGVIACVVLIVSFDEGYKEFQEKCKKRTIEYLKKHHIKNTKITYRDNMKKSYNIQLRNMLKNGTFVNVEKQFEVCL